LHQLLENLTNQPKENEWIEFKGDFHSKDEIGELISALSNGACLHNQEAGYLVFGIEDNTHNVVGTNFKLSEKNQEMKNWKIG
jgi:ATP-dependent DNA helicase RecG